jgi:hypothetical protein
VKITDIGVDKHGMPTVNGKKLVNFRYGTQTNIYEEVFEPFKVYCDMDGVLCDFEEAFQELTGDSVEHFRATHKQQDMWDLMGEQEPEFWGKMPWMPDGEELWEYIRTFKPTILTSPFLTKNCHIGKYDWCGENLGPEIEVIINKDKYKHADSKSILIDDREDVLEKWRKAGGIGLTHTSAANTIATLKDYGLIS